MVGICLAQYAKETKRVTLSLIDEHGSATGNNLKTEIVITAV
jgi:hypothetical protein